MLRKVRLKKNYFIGKSAMQGVKLKMALGLPVGALINCADNSGMRINNFRSKKYLYICCEKSSSLS